MPRNLTPHPRLYVSAEQLESLRRPVAMPSLRAAQEEVARSAEAFARQAEIQYQRDTHNEHLLRARVTQTRVVTLLVRHFQTGQQRYREAALRDLRAMCGWEYWSWITWRQNNPDPLAIFDLSYGENSATLALAFDWLHDSLSQADRKLFLDTARRRVFASFLRHTSSEKPGKHIWWYKFRESNWNTVCAGGAGMLALAMREEAPEARAVLARADRSIGFYMKHLNKSDGAWPEGIGYWNYGMRYAFMYLLSHERACGRRHPLIEQSATRKTLYFPLDFTPNGVPCSFGDVNSFAPLPFHFAAARRLGAADLIQAMTARLPGWWETTGGWPNSAEALLLCPPALGKAAPPQRQVARLYKGQDWAILADQMPRPHLYLAIRGGTTEVPHGHRDLLSFHAVVGDEGMINNLSVGEYLDSTFGPRRFEIFETSPPSKNTILVNGVGITGQSTVQTTPVRVGAARGFHLDASTCFGTMRDGSAVIFAGRLFLLLKGRSGPAALIVDRVEMPHVGRVESRLHTFADVALQSAGARLMGKRQRLTLAFAADVPAQVLRAADAPTTPGPSATMIRWCPRQLHAQVTLATLLSPGAKAARVSLQTSRGKLQITARIGGESHRFTLTPRLRPRR